MIKSLLLPGQGCISSDCLTCLYPLCSHNSTAAWAWRLSMICDWDWGAIPDARLPVSGSPLAMHFQSIATYGKNSKSFIGQALFMMTMSLIQVAVRRWLQRRSHVSTASAQEVPCIEHALPTGAIAPEASMCSKGIAYLTEDTRLHQLTPDEVHPSMPCSATWTHKACCPVPDMHSTSFSSSATGTQHMGSPLSMSASAVQTTQSQDQIQGPESLQSAANADGEDMGMWARIIQSMLHAVHRPGAQGLRAYEPVPSELQLSDSSVNTMKRVTETADQVEHVQMWAREDTDSAAELDLHELQQLLRSHEEWGEQIAPETACIHESTMYPSDQAFGSGRPDGTIESVYRRNT